MDDKELDEIMEAIAAAIGFVLTQEAEDEIQQIRALIESYGVTMYQRGGMEAL